MAKRFKIDENLPVEVAEMLRMAGHDAYTVLEQNLGGSADRDIAQICQQEDRILITLDMDFADIRTYPPSEYPGLVVFRIKQQDRLTVLALLLRILPNLDRESLGNRLWIVDEKRIRIRM